MSELDDRTGRYMKLYSDNIDKITAGSSSYINSFRQEAINEFSKLGIPTKRNESYKYTNLDRKSVV
jgi:Fe-S cluster assembly protein SufD